eukprot:6407017-Alexandrium_andersonii.AAC.1
MDRSMDDRSIDRSIDDGDGVGNCNRSSGLSCACGLQCTRWSQRASPLAVDEHPLCPWNCAAPRPGSIVYTSIYNCLTAGAHSCA